jgi:protein ImuA
MVRFLMSIPRLSSSGSKSRPTQILIEPLSLSRGRVHEFCGPSRHMLAAFVMRETTGLVIWIHPGWQDDRLLPDGLCEMADPGRLVFASARRPEDLFWSMEEALRSGAVAMVVTELTAPPTLTPVRRLNLAAEAGLETARSSGRLAPIGLLLTPGDGGAQGIESRWHLVPHHGASITAWQLSRLRARIEPPKTWTVERDRAGRPRLADRVETVLTSA